MKKLVMVCFMVDGMDNPEWTYELVPHDQHIDMAWAGQVARNWLNEHYDDSDDYTEIWFDELTKVDGYPIKVGCRQERSNA